MKNLNVLIIGAGNIGYQLAKKLSNDQFSITLIEMDPKRVQYVREHIDAHIFEGSGTSLELLKNAGIEDTDIFAALSNDDEVNLVACAIAKQFNVDTTIARVRNPEYMEDDHVLMKTEFGADYIIQPEWQAARVILRLIRQASATDIIEFDGGKFQLMGIRLDANTPVLNTPLMELGNQYGNPPIRIIAIKRGQFTIIPRGDSILVNGDQLYFICSPEYINDALNYFGKADTKVENIMIIGGGQIGTFISQELERNIKIKIIEQDEKKANILVDKLQKTLVIKGDGSDLDLLTFEGLTEMDEFIAITGDDETNIITSLIAKHLKVPRTITLLSKQEYLPLTPTIGLDAVVSKEQITVNAIKKIIRRRQVAFYAELPGLDAKIIEFIAKKHSKIVRKSLMETKFPKDALVGAILKNGETLEIPTGTSQIEPGDKVVVFTLSSSVNEVEKLFRSIL